MLIKEQALMYPSILGRPAGTLQQQVIPRTASFVTTADGHGGTLVTEATQVEQQPTLTKPHA